LITQERANRESKVTRWRSLCDTERDDFKRNTRLLGVPSKNTAPGEKKKNTDFRDCRPSPSP